MYAGRVACFPKVSHGEYADRTDRQTPYRYITLSVTDAANLITGCCVNGVLLEVRKAHTPVGRRKTISRSVLGNNEYCYHVLYRVEETLLLRVGLAPAELLVHNAKDA